MSARRLSSLVVVLAVWLALPSVASPATPGSNGRIVYSSSRDASWQSELYSIAPDGTGATRLTFTPTIEQNPAWSPDGNLIAFESFEDTHPTIHVMTAYGEDERRLSPEGATDSDPTWSADGSEIAFTSSTRGSASGIWAMNADGSGARFVTSGAQPDWSPDGTRIAHVSTSVGERIAVVNPDGSGLRLLTSPPPGYLDGQPSWSPDGSRLVFVRRDSSNASRLYVVDADGSNERQLTAEAGGHGPSWSPDGTQIVFTHDRRLYVIGPDGAGMRPLTSEWGDALAPDWGTPTTLPSPQDPGAPTIHIVSPSPHDAYFPGDEVPAFYLCVSETSPVVLCEGDVPFGALVDTETTGTRTFTVRAMDAEGRRSSATVTFQVLDWRPPTVVVRAPADGAEYQLGESVVVDYECRDEPGGSGVEVCDGDLRPGQPLDTSRVGTFTVRFWAVDRARNLTHKSVTYRVVYRDVTPPTITIDNPRPGDGVSFLLGATALASYHCADEHGGSGLESCAGSVPSGAPLDTSSVGTRSLSVRARDRAGNASSLTRSYRVVYAFSGFFAPLVALPAMASLDAGDTVPVKFSLAGDRGLGILAPGSPTWSRIDCASGSPLGDASGARHALSYLAGTDRYQLRVESDASWAGTCRRLAVGLADGTTHLANVRFG